MASSVSAAPVVVPQAAKRTHAEMSNSETSSQPPASDETLNDTNPNVRSKSEESQIASVTNDSDKAVANKPTDDKKAAVVSLSESSASVDCDPLTQSKKSTSSVQIPADAKENEAKLTSNGTSAAKHTQVNTLNSKESKNTAEQNPTSNALTPSSHVTESSEEGVSGQIKSVPEPMETSVATASQNNTAKSSMETAASQSKSAANKTFKNTNVNNNKPQLEDGEEPEKKAKIAHTSSTSKEGAKTPEQVLELMDKTFDQRRKIITKQMPTIPELKELYPDLFTGKQLLLEFQRITKIDIDQKIQEFCVRYATAVIELARNQKGAAPVLARWEQAKQENDTLRQYWDMVTALCLLPLHFGENFVEMVLEIGEDEEVVAQGKIVPTLVARGNIFRTDEFFLIAENTIVQEFEEFTIAFASLYSSYWVFNMVYPETIENTYNYIQRCIVRQREPGAIPLECKNFTKTLVKWNKEKHGK